MSSTDRIVDRAIGAMAFDLVRACRAEVLSLWKKFV
jgi:hypothetical protein